MNQRELAVFHLEKRRLKSDLLNVYKSLKGRYEEDRINLFLVVPTERTRGKGYKLKHRRVPLNIRKHL